MSSVAIIIEYRNPLYMTGINMAYTAPTDSVKSYSHVISADYGFKSANFEISMTEEDVNDWIDYGLGKDIMVYDGEGTNIWKGFVNKVSASIGDRTYSVGPLMDVANRVTLIYTPIIESATGGLILGVTQEYPMVQNTDSQALYGIIEKVISGSNMFDSEAGLAANSYATEFGTPPKDESLSILQSNVPIVRIECLGYKEWLNAYAYNNTAITLTYFHTKIQSVVNADPNNIFSHDYSEMVNNLSLTNDYEYENKTAYTIVDGITKMGDIAYNRWNVQVLENNMIYYKSIPNLLEYYHPIKQGVPYIYSSAYAHIMPWNVRPGKWLMYTDVNIGTMPTSILNSPLVKFVEEVTYTMPYGLSLSFSRFSTVRQLFQTLGIGSI